MSTTSTDLNVPVDSTEMDSTTSDSESSTSQRQIYHSTKMDSTSDAEAPTSQRRIYRGGSGVRQKLDALKETIVHRPPFCSGSLSVDPEELVLFYGRDTENGNPIAG